MLGSCHSQVISQLPYKRTIGVRKRNWRHYQNERASTDTTKLLWFQGSIACPWTISAGSSLFLKIFFKKQLSSLVFLLFLLWF